MEEAVIPSGPSGPALSEARFTQDTASTRSLIEALSRVDSTRMRGAEQALDLLMDKLIEAPVGAGIEAEGVELLDP